MQRRGRIVGIPMDLGQQRRGVDMGPSAIRYAGLFDALFKIGYMPEDAGNILAPGRDEARARDDALANTESQNLRHLSAVVETCEEIYSMARECLASGDFAIFLGGDHSISIGTVAGVSRADRVGLIWIDAHADFNTPETTPSGNIHGMPLAVLTGRGHDALVNLGHAGPKVHADDVVLVGLRDVDEDERDSLASSGIHVYTMRDIDELGMANIARRGLAQVGETSHVHVSLDMDSLDPAYAPGVGTPVLGGITSREAHLLMEILAESGAVDSVDVVEVNPILDDGNRTAELAVDLVASLLGRRIL